MRLCCQVPPEARETQSPIGQGPQLHQVLLPDLVAGRTWLPLDKSGRWTVWSSWPQPNLAIYQPAAVGFYFSQNGKIGSFVIGFDRWRPDVVANWPDRVIHFPWLLKPIRAKGQPPALWLEVHNESVVYWLGKRQRVQCLCIRLVRKCTCWVWGYGVELVLAN